MLESSLMLHESSIVSGKLERTSGVARPTFERYQPQAGEMLFIFSNIGVNCAPVEMALLAKEHGLISVAVCSLSYARVAPLSSAGQRLFEVTEYAIDNGGEQGDSLIALEGMPWRVGPSSTVINALIWNALITEVAFILQACGAALPVFGSSNLPGATEHNAALLQKWRARNPHI
ncbi:MAG: sugar isomerase domain-containing protein [Chloroflexi bacterium]|nr:sugar isomerase domain-containing protein [Chloroflexota bacterium]